MLAVEHHAWPEGSCAADWGCAILDQLSGTREGQGEFKSLLLSMLTVMMTGSISKSLSASMFLLSASSLPPFQLVCLDWLQLSLPLQLPPIRPAPCSLMSTLCSDPEPACAGYLQWLNNVLTELWPYYDKAASAMIKASRFPMLYEDHLPCEELVRGHMPLICLMIHAVLAVS